MLLAYMKATHTRMCKAHLKSDKARIAEHEKASDPEAAEGSKPVKLAPLPCF